MFEEVDAVLLTISDKMDLDFAVQVRRESSERRALACCSYICIKSCL